MQIELSNYFIFERIFAFVSTILQMGDCVYFEVSSKLIIHHIIVKWTSFLSNIVPVSVCNSLSITVKEIVVVGPTILLYAIKFALEGISEPIQYELELFGIKNHSYRAWRLWCRGKIFIYYSAT